MRVIFELIESSYELYSIRRFFYLCFLLLLSSLTCVLLSPLLVKSTQVISDVLCNWHVLIQYAVCIMLSGVVWVLVFNLGGFRFKDFYFWKSYRFIPVWIFALSGCLVYIYMEIYLSSLGIFSRDDFYPASIDFGIIITGAFIFPLIIESGTFFRKTDKSGTIEQQNIVNIKDLLKHHDKFIEWLNDETPIQHPSQDLFGVSVMAKRIARLLCEKKCKTICVIGNYGCGKSSMLNLVEYYLKNNIENSNNYLSYDNLIISRVGGWGLKEESVAEYILESAIDELKKYVDCISISSLPENYRAGLDGLGNPAISSLCALLGGRKNPEETLKVMDEILIAAELRLIIIIEDLDRNVNSRKYWSEISSLFDRLKDLKNVTFVLCIGPEYKDAGALIRICEHTESFPPPYVWGC